MQPKIPITEQVKHARSAAVPLIAIETADPNATAIAITKAASEAAKPYPVIGWDVVSGLYARNKLAAKAIAAIMPPPDPAFAGIPGGTNASTNPVDMLTKLVDLEERALVIVQNGQRLIGPQAEQSGASYPIVQGLLNLRDDFKRNVRTLVLVGYQFEIPLELRHDIMLISEPLPTRDEIAAIIARECDGYRSAFPEAPEQTAEARAQAAEALSGLSAFSSEQATAVTLSANGGRLDMPSLWTRKRAFVKQTKGLTFEPFEGPTLADLGGLEELITFGRAIGNGDPRPSMIVRMEEIEKTIGTGAALDGGVSSYNLATMLNAMEDNDWEGLITVGPPGSGKSEFSKALPREFGIPCLTFDPGEVKDRFVGSSEANIRAAMRMIEAIGGRNVYFVATSNNLQVIPAALRRRFTGGVWFVDLPNEREREAIWTIQLRRRGLDENQPRPNDDQWSGAEIRNCCRLAARLRMPLIHAARWILPVALADKDGLAKLRQSAAGNYFNASAPGPYIYTPPVTVPKTAARGYDS